MLTRTHLWQPRDRAWRSRPTGKAFLALLVMVTFGLFPFHQILHLVFADHSHRYCRVHYQIEDVYPADEHNPIVIGTEDPANETVQPPGAASRDRNQSHHGCDILNLCFESRSVSALREPAESVNRMLPEWRRRTWPLISSGHAPWSCSPQAFPRPRRSAGSPRNRNFHRTSEPAVFETDRWIPNIDALIQRMQGMSA